MRGAQAISYLRQQFDDAGGTAARFREAMLSTFEGQKRLLRGSMETLAIIAGEPFAQVFRPLVTVVVGVVNAVLDVFRQLPGPVKRAFAAFVVGAGAVVALVGAVISAKAGLALLVLGLKAAGLTMGGLLAVVLPGVAAFGVLALAVAGFAVAFRRDVGGVADFFGRVGAAVSLTFRGLVQLFDEGGFSGAVREELNRVESQGLKDFLINVYLWANRLGRFFSGVGEGFTAGLEAAAPALEAFVGVLRQLGASLGFLSARDDAGTAAARFAAFGSVGEAVGRALAGVFAFLVEVMTAVAEVAQGVVDGGEWVGAAAAVVRDALGQLGAKVADVTGTLFGGTSVLEGYGGGWRVLGGVIAVVVGGVVALVGVLVAAVTAALSIVDAAFQAVAGVFNGVADAIDGVLLVLRGLAGGGWADVWTGMKLVAFGVVDAILGALLALAGAIGGVIDAMAGLFGGEAYRQRGVKQAREALRADMAEAMGVEDVTVARPVRASAGVGPGAAGAVASGEALASMPAVAAMAPAVPASFSACQVSQAPAAPVVVQLQVDGQTLATAVHRADRDASGRAFSPVPLY